MIAHQKIKCRIMLKIWLSPIFCILKIKGTYACILVIARPRSNRMSAQAPRTYFPSWARTGQKVAITTTAWAALILVSGATWMIFNISSNKMSAPDLSEPPSLLFRTTGFTEQTAELTMQQMCRTTRRPSSTRSIGNNWSSQPLVI